MSEHLVIIGGVAAGTKAAAKAKRENPDLNVSIYTNEKYISYSACGIPYFIENTFDDAKRLIVRTKEEFKEKEDIDIYIEHNVLSINCENQEIEVQNLADSQTFNLNYDKLLIATGASPVIPKIEGTNLKNVYTIRTIEDALNIKNALSNAKKAIIVGAGYIGIEVLEAFASQNVDTTVVELSNQVLPIFDEDFSVKIKEFIEEKCECDYQSKVHVITGDGLKKIISKDHAVTGIETQSGKILDTDIVILAVGVKPNVSIAKQAGIELGTTGAIKVNAQMQTNIENVYAAGDCAEQHHIITNKPVWIPLGPTANKQGRVAASNITGHKSYFKGVLGSAITKFHNYTFAKTGLGEKELTELGWDYEIALITNKDKSGYMPSAKPITIKLLAHSETKKLLGAQIIGLGDVDKRINVIATALNAGMTVTDLLDTDLPYAPPFSTAIDPILRAAQVLENKLYKKANGIKPEKVEEYLKEHCNYCLVSVNDNHKMVEYEGKKLIVCCTDGMDSYIFTQKLKKMGFKDVQFVDGGLEKEAKN